MQARQAREQQPEGDHHAQVAQVEPQGRYPGAATQQVGADHGQPDQGKARQRGLAGVAQQQTGQYRIDRPEQRQGFDRAGEDAAQRPGEGQAE